MSIDPTTIKLQQATGQRLYIETYGCQMNNADSEVVVSVMMNAGYALTDKLAEADVVLINTCSIRDNAEQRIWGRLRELRIYKKRNKGLVVGVIGCMAERLKEQLSERENLVDVIAGPDSYRDMPRLVDTALGGSKAINVLLSREETYAEIAPVRLDKNGVSAYVSIMRGCNNMCSYCVVPYTRGGERSREPQSILNEVRELVKNGYKEVTLLGQNVNSYSCGDVTFASLLEQTAMITPQLRVRFSTSHPKDLSDEVLHMMARYPNLCKAIHLPAQSGNSRMLDKMNRKYSREWYMGRIDAIKSILPDCTITTDIITGFCSETEDEHRDTLSLMEWVGYAFAFMYKYSMRPNTKAEREFEDDVDEQTKIRRLTEVINLQRKLSLESNKKDVGKTFEVLAEGISKRDEGEFSGRTSQNKVVIFPRRDHKVGDYVNVLITECSSATLKGISIDQ